MIAPVRPERREPDHERAAGARPRAAEVPPGPHPLEPMAQDLAALRIHIVDYLTLQADRAKLQARQGALYAALGILGGIVGATGLIYATVLLLRGIAYGLADLFNAELWVGELIVGLGLLLIAGLATYLGIRHFTSVSRNRTIEKHEHRRQERYPRAGAAESHPLGRPAAPGTSTAAPPVGTE